jgi:hypothetical protein
VPVDDRLPRPGGARQALPSWYRSGFRFRGRRRPAFPGYGVCRGPQPWRRAQD